VLEDPKIAAIKLISDLEKIEKNHPRLVAGSWIDALESAKANVKFLVIYLHGHQNNSNIYYK
jgi:hypothetical protein